MNEGLSSPDVFPFLNVRSVLFDVVLEVTVIFDPFVIFDPVPLPPVAVASNVDRVYTVAAVVRTKATPKIIAINNLLSMEESSDSTIYALHSSKSVVQPNKPLGGSVVTVDILTRSVYPKTSCFIPPY